jgi:hypothetical protein
MGIKPLGVAAIAGDAQVDHAIATLVLAFVTDPVARWMYDDPHQYCCTFLGYSAPSDQARLKQEQRSAPATALGSRFGCRRAFTEKMGRLRRRSQKASLGRSKPKSPPSSSGRNIIGRSSPIGTYRSSGSKHCIGTTDAVRHCYSIAFVNATASTCRHTFGHRTR